MNTPIADFVREYAKKNISRFHMPGHKGQAFLGCEAYDITEVAGADALYEAEGIIGQSEMQATKLFGTGRTVYSTEGSSQCIRAMLYLAVNEWKRKRLLSDKVSEDVSENKYNRPYVVAGRNTHKAFLYGAALLDFDIVWLWPKEMHSICSCHIEPEQVEAVLQQEIKIRGIQPAAVYLTSPDYLGGMVDVAAIADICHRYGTILAVDNAHGAYLHFLPEKIHPMDLGADICCDSAHKTLPVLTGGAYLQINKNAPEAFAENVKQAMALFGSTSPSYLIMSSLDLCNQYLAEGYEQRLEVTAKHIDRIRNELAESGWQIERTDPLKITIRMPEGVTGQELAEKLRQGDVECEYADTEYVVLMATPENTQEDFRKMVIAFGQNDRPYVEKSHLHPVKCEQVCSVKDAIYGDREVICIKDAIGRVCGSPTVGCPPAIPIAVSGEMINQNAIALFEYYGIEKIEVLK